MLCLHSVSNITATLLCVSVCVVRDGSVGVAGHLSVYALGKCVYDTALMCVRFCNSWLSYGILWSEGSDPVCL